MINTALNFSAEILSSYISPAPPSSVAYSVKEVSKS